MALCCRAYAAEKNSALEPFLACWYSQLAEHSFPYVQLYYFKSRRIHMVFNKQAADFLSGLISRAEI